MRKLTTTLISAWLAAATFAAATPMSADDYVFFKIGNTNQITGTVMDGGSVRFEDFAFLNEASLEREALSRSGYYSNEFATVVSGTNVNFAGQITAFRTAANTILDRFLDPDCQISTQPRVIREPGRDYGTNVSIGVTSLSWKTNTYLIGGSTITRTLADGTVDVYTNATYTIVSNVLESSFTTNIYPELMYRDFCMADRAFDMSGSRVWKVLHATRNSPTVFGTYSVATLSNNYNLVRAMRRTLPTGYEFEINATTNGTVTTINNGTVTTRTAKFSSYSVESTVSAIESDVQDRDGDEWLSRQGYPINQQTTSSHANIPSSLPLRVLTQLSTYLTDYKSQYGRVKTADVFANVTLTHQTRLASSHSTATGTETDVSTNIVRTAMVMVPAGTATREPGGNFLRMTVDAGNVYRQACEAVGFPYLDPSYEPTLPGAAAADWTYQGDNTRSKNRSRLAYEKISGTIDVYMILNLNPNTKLTNWSEYD